MPTPTDEEGEVDPKVDNGEAPLLDDDATWDDPELGSEPVASPEQRRKFREEALSAQHALTHLPKNRYCGARNQGKMPQYVAKAGALQRPTERFGNVVTCDHLISRSMQNRGMRGEANALTVKDLHTNLTMCYPVFTKNAEETEEALRHFKGNRKVDVIYSDNADELIKATRKIKAKHHPSVTGVPKSNAIVERTNQIVRDGVATALPRAGVPACYWSYGAPAWCMNYNCSVRSQDDASTPWERVNDERFKGILIPFGALVIHLPSPSRETYEQRKWDAKARFGVFAGYVLSSASGWTKKYQVWDLQAFINSDLRAAATRKTQKIGHLQIVCDGACSQ